MTDDKQALAVDGARFFGEMTASISHEIKNVMAIINENAGLLGDFVTMHQRGCPLPADRIAKVAQSIAHQISRADDIVQTMNRFAHSADRSVETVNIADAVQFLTHLASRLIVMRGVRFDISAPDGPVAITCNRFFLEYLVWRCMVVATEACSPNQTIRIRVDATGNGSRLAFSGLDKGDGFSWASFSEIKRSGVLILLNAQLYLEPESGEFILTFSRE